MSKSESPTENVVSEGGEEQMRNLALLKGMRYYYEQLSTMQRQFLQSNNTVAPESHSPTSNQRTDSFLLIYSTCKFLGATVEAHSCHGVKRPWV